MRILRFYWCLFVSNQWFEVIIRESRAGLLRLLFILKKYLQERNWLLSNNVISFAIAWRLSTGVERKAPVANLIASVMMGCKVFRFDWAAPVIMGKE